MDRFAPTCARVCVRLFVGEELHTLRYLNPSLSFLPGEGISMPRGTLPFEEPKTQRNQQRVRARRSLLTSPGSPPLERHSVATSYSVYGLSRLFAYLPCVPGNATRTVSSRNFQGIVYSAESSERRMDPVESNPERSETANVVHT